MTKKLLATSFFAACIATTALTSSIVLAENAGVYFYPENKWTVEQIGDSAEGKGQICAVSNQLNNGYIVQIAGDSSGFTNLNIDFRQDSFETNLKYEVKYSVPGIAEKVIPTKAFKKNLLVSDLRGEKDLASALQTASVLDVQIRDTEFRMYMTGLEATMEQYADCINPAPVAISSNEQNIEDAPQIEEQENVVAVPTHKLRPAPLARPRYTEALARQLKEESKEYQPAQPENAAQEMEVESSTSARSSAPIYNVTKFNSGLVDLTGSGSAQQSNNNAAVIASSEQAKEDIDAEMEAEMLSVISPAAGIVDDDITNTRSKIDDLEKQIGVLLNKNKMLNEELKLVLHDAEDEKLSVSSDNWNLERATMKFNEAERQIMRLGRKLQAQKAQCKNEKIELENMLFDPKLTNQSQLATLASLESELDRAKSDLYRQQRQYEERIRLLEVQLKAQ